MTDEQDQPPLSPQSRKFLEKLLADCRQHECPGDGALIKMIEEALAGKRLPHDPTKE